MRSQVRFFMHPVDETEFLTYVLGEPGVLLVDGVNWPTSQPVV
jgi:hypothetical protein